ncbi:MAG: flagellar hook capping FlgD N-terminal domain-containing protein, partial [Pseudolabrys sp.]
MTTINPASTATGAGSVSNALDKTEIAGNFTTFLQLLTTQLKNQNPLDPLDTNQFTQQLVQFAQVEQQMKSNDQLSSLVSLKKSAQATTALAYVGATVVGDGSTAQLTGGNANWSLNVTKQCRQLQSLSRIRPVRTSIPTPLSRHAEFHL